jgi:hypothetical protein
VVFLSILLVGSTGIDQAKSKSSGEWTRKTPVILRKKALVDLVGKKNTSYVLDQVTNYALEQAPVDRPTGMTPIMHRNLP